MEGVEDAVDVVEFEHAVVVHVELYIKFVLDLTQNELVPGDHPPYAVCDTA